MTPRPIDAEILLEALRQAPSLIMITDASLTITYVSRVEHGYRIEDVVGRGLGLALPPEQRRKLDRACQEALASGRSEQYEVFLDTPSGRRRWYASQVSPYRACDGTVAGFIAIVVDVTHQREAEIHAERLRSEVMETSHRVGMAEIASGVLHEIGSALDDADAATDGFATRLASSRPHQLERALAMLEDDPARLAERLADPARARALVAFLGELRRELELDQQRLRDELVRLRERLASARSAIETQQSLDRLGTMVEPTQLDQLIEAGLSMFQLDLEEHVIALRLELPDFGVVMLDRQAMLQVLASVIRNAIDALAAVERPRRLAIRLYGNEYALCLDVEDNGVGIAAADLERVFQRGFSTKPSGHGFGLYNASVAARSMNGTLEARSDGPDRGARLHLLIPRVVPS